MENNNQSTNDKHPSGKLYEEDGPSVSVLDVLLVLTRNRRLIGVTVLVFGLLGFISILIPEEPTYEASATVIREGEAPSTQSNWALRQMGISIGQESTGISAATYPDILTSREVRLSVVRDTFDLQGTAGPVTFVALANRPAEWTDKLMGTIKKYTIRLPATIKAMTATKRPPSRAPVESQNPYPTRAEEIAMRKVENLVDVSVDRKGLMSISATTEDPLLSVQLVNSFIEHFSERVRAFRTEKARQNLEFIQQRLDEAEAELRNAEEELARFMDRNMGVQTAQLRTQRERLERTVQFKSQLYSSMLTQHTQAELDLQRSTPVITILEEPVPPLGGNSGSNPTAAMMMSVIFGFFAGSALAFGKVFIQNQRRDKERARMLSEIESTMVPAWVKKGIAKVGRRSRGEHVGS